MPEMVTVNARELYNTVGTSSKYWRVFSVWTPYTVATHYGRIGRMGAVTVHHTMQKDAITLLYSKREKGYSVSHEFSFEMPLALAREAQSTNNHTGSGGSNKLAAWAMVAYYHAACHARNIVPVAKDPIGEFVTDNAAAYKIGLASHAGIPLSKEILEYDVVDLEVLAGLSVSDYAMLQ